MTLTASGDAAAYHWDLGDGSVADGPVVQHQYGAGRFTATVTATDAGGETAQASVVITSAQLSLSGPKVGTYGRRSAFRGRMVPALKGAPITLYSGDSPVRIDQAGQEGRFAVRLRQSGPATYTARFETVSRRTRSPSRFARAWTSLVPALRECSAGRSSSAPSSGRGAPSCTIRVWKSGRELPAKDFGGRAVVHLSTKRVASYVVRITVDPDRCLRRPPEDRRARTSSCPTSADGAHGPSVRILERRLARAPLPAARRRQLLLVRHRRRGARLPEGERPRANRPGHAVRLAPPPDPRTSRGPRYRFGHHIEVDKTRAGALRGRPRTRRPGRARLDRRDGQHPGRPLAHLQQGPGHAPDGNVRLELLPARVRDPRLPVRAHVSRLPRLRAARRSGRPRSSSPRATTARRFTSTTSDWFWTLLRRPRTGPGRHRRGSA